MSKIKVNTIAPRSGTTVTLGESGDTIALGACASQTGFGRTGTVDWCTTAKTSPFTAVSGNGYMVNTCGGAVTVTLPSSPSGGDIVSIADYKSTWGTACKSVTLGRNSSKINGQCNDSSLSTSGQSVTMVYIDGTQGWKSVQDSTSDVTGISYMAASGGCVSTTGNYKIHTFNASANFIVSSLSSCAALNKVDYMVVGGGGGGGASEGGGGGGAGGFRETPGTATGCYTTSPLAGGTAVTVTASTYPVTIGAGASAGGPGATAGPGSASCFSSTPSAGGGGGGAYGYGGDNGGSGGGGGGRSNTPGGTGNTPPVSPAQGKNGGPSKIPASNPDLGGGGGGATVAGTPGGCAPNPGGGGPGGAGATTHITGSPVAYAGGGGGGKDADSPNSAPSGCGGAGGGGNGSSTDPGSARSGTAGGTNTGGGGGGGGGTNYAGGSGVVILRYRYQ
jgi:hypothetical protein